MKTALITGSGSGIGLATAKRLLKDRYTVIGHFHNPSPGLAQLKEEYADTLYVSQKDLLQPGAVQSLWKEIETTHEGVDILINNAAIIPDPAPIESLSEKAFDDALNMNLKVPFLLAQKVLPWMTRNRWGRIVNISSIGIKFGGGRQTAHYAISKAALETLSASLHRVCCPYNILVNTVRVGVTNTKMHASVSEKNLEERIKLIPLKRMAEPSEIANTISFLISEESSYIAGSTLTVAGGE